LMENTIRLDLNETPCNSNDEDGNCKSTEAENGGGVMSENSIDDVVSLDNMDEAAVDNMVNASMENMAEAVVDNMAKASVDNMAEPAVDIWVEGANVHMMKVIRLNCKYGGKKQTNGSIVTGCPVYVFGRMIDDKMSYNSLLVESGGHENITYNQRDVRNVVHLNRRKSRLEGDVVALDKYFHQQYEYNQEFYSAIERDDDGRLMNAFWSDARRRAMHKDFGDIINLTLRSCATSDETLTQYCMGNPPKGILTDQCKAIGKAVETVFVGVPHKLCLWHILQMLKEFGKTFQVEEIEEALRNVVHDTLDPMSLMKHGG
ncbi:Protein FAR-RED IMPAIRED RESPONSE 1, partial [Bienertia sinuspersici]